LARPIPVSTDGDYRSVGRCTTSAASHDDHGRSSDNDDDHVDNYDDHVGTSIDDDHVDNYDYVCTPIDDDHVDDATPNDDDHDHVGYHNPDYNGRLVRPPRPTTSSTTTLSQSGD